MRKSIATLVCGSALLVSFCGCGASTTTDTTVPIEVANKPDSKEDLKKRLEDIGKSGQLGSSVAGLRPAIQELEPKDLADDLLKDFSKLENAKTPDEIKSITKRMIGKL